MVAVGYTLPLTCVTIRTNPPTAPQWYKSGAQLISTVDQNVINENYTSPNGTSYVISTLLLCNVGFDDGGTYMCGVGGMSGESFTVTVHGIHSPLASDSQDNAYQHLYVLDCT